MGPTLTFLDSVEEAVGSLKFGVLLLFYNVKGAVAVYSQVF